VADHEHPLAVALPSQLVEESGDPFGGLAPALAARVADVDVGP
jgi:hypothetical protein